jgi:hypothetical protein
MIIYDRGILKTHAGDSYSFAVKIKGLIPYTDYEIFYQINGRPPVVKSEKTTTDESGSATVLFNIAVEENSRPGTFTYGIKTCKDGLEDTVKCGTLVVLDKIVEGTI